MAKNKTSWLNWFVPGIILIALILYLCQIFSAVAPGADTVADNTLKQKALDYYMRLADDVSQLSVLLFGWLWSLFVFGDLKSTLKKQSSLWMSIVAASLALVLAVCFRCKLLLDVAGSIQAGKTDVLPDINSGMMLSLQHGQLACLLCAFFLCIYLSYATFHADAS